MNTAEWKQKERACMNGNGLGYCCTKFTKTAYESKRNECTIYFGGSGDNLMRFASVGNTHLAYFALGQCSCQHCSCQCIGH